MSTPFVGMTLRRVRVAFEELVVISFDKPGEPEAHLICRPEARMIFPAGGGHAQVHVVGMNYEVGTSDLTIPSHDTQELCGEASQVLGRVVVVATHNPGSHVFGFQLDAAYNLIVTPMGLKVIYGKELECQFRKPVVLN